MGHDSSSGAVERLYCDLLEATLHSKCSPLVEAAVKPFSTASFSPVADLDDDIGGNLGKILFDYCCAELSQGQRIEKCAPFLIRYNLIFLLAKLQAFEFPKSYKLEEEEYDRAQRKVEDAYAALRIMAQEPKQLQAALSDKQRETLLSLLPHFVGLWLKRREPMWQQWRKEVFENSLKIIYDATKNSNISRAELFKQLEKWIDNADEYNVLPLLLDIMRNCSTSHFELFIEKQLSIAESSEDQHRVLIALTCYTQLRPIPEKVASSVSRRFIGTMQSRLATLLMNAH